ncbi:MAG TPA: hypothetical protein VH062_27600 [Polyangiaceae bacterium]|jgi:hypothetical protein|nr:hypothetical protein [Polyangiaceae bacterium]
MSRSPWDVAPALVAFTLAGCGLGAELPSDPAAYDPPLAVASVGASEADAAVAVLDGGGAGCDEEPPFDAELTVSSAHARSHLAGQPCLEGCHAAGGTAMKVFAAAGTVHGSSTSRAVARSGSVQNVGGTSLAVDGCGNVYATLDALATDPRLTQPFVQSPSLHRMDKPLSRQPFAGSCNQSGCHDFGSALRWGVYF